MSSGITEVPVESLKKICREIGCSGLSPDLCQNKPYLCGIIRKAIGIDNASKPR